MLTLETLRLLEERLEERRVLEEEVVGLLRARGKDDVERDVIVLLSIILGRLVSQLSLQSFFLDLLRLGLVAGSPFMPIAAANGLELVAYAGNGAREAMLLLLSIFAFKGDLAASVVVAVVGEGGGEAVRAVANSLFLGVVPAPGSDEELVSGVAVEEGGEGVAGVEGGDFDSVGDDFGGHPLLDRRDLGPRHGDGRLPACERNQVSLRALAESREHNTEDVGAESEMALGLKEA